MKNHKLTIALVLFVNLCTLSAFGEDPAPEVAAVSESELLPTPPVSDVWCRQMPEDVDLFDIENFTPSANYAAMSAYVRQEFYPTTNDERLFQHLDRLLSASDAAIDSINEKDSAIFCKILHELRFNDLKLYRRTRVYLKRQITYAENIALRLSRGIGRTERGIDPNLAGFSGNYTADQIARKVKILKLAKFPIEERLILLQKKTLEEPLTEFTASNFILTPGSPGNESPEFAQAMNQEVLKAMHAESARVLANPYNTSLDVGIDKAKAVELYEAVTRHPVVRLFEVSNYDPDHILGFCFGRAMAAHLEATQRHIHGDAIRKVFVTGSMSAIIGDIVWQFHVVTAINNIEGGWWIIDPMMGEIVTLDQWILKMKAHDIDGYLRLFVSEANRFGATTANGYQKSHLLDESYNKYFADLLAYNRLAAKGMAPEKSLFYKLLDPILKFFKLGF